MIETEKLIKAFGTPPLEVLHALTFKIHDGEYVALTGRSGSGKSTLLYCLSTLDTATSGRILIDGRNTATMSSEDLHKFRNREVGFVFQFHYLLPELTALENVLIPAQKAGLAEERRTYARDLLDRFGLSDKEHRLPTQLSGGEQQRVAVARALVMKPRYLFADEPTGNLDTASGEIVMEHIAQVNKEDKTTILLVTHDPEFARRAQRQIHLVDGRISS